MFTSSNMGKSVRASLSPQRSVENDQLIFEIQDGRLPPSPIFVKKKRSMFCMARENIVNIQITSSQVGCVWGCLTCLLKGFQFNCLTDFFIEGKSLKHALVRQCLFCWAVWDQPVSLGLKLTLKIKTEKTGFTYNLVLCVKLLVEYLKKEHCLVLETEFKLWTLTLKILMRLFLSPRTE